MRMPLPIILLAMLPIAGAEAPPSTQPASPATQPDQPPATQPDKAAEKLTIGGKSFLLEVAADAASRERGLMDRELLGDDRGMLFIFPRAERRNFWMKNCRMDIDVIFLDNDGRITALHKMKPEPPKRDDETMEQYERRMKLYSSRRPARFAIELKAGKTDELGLKMGDVIAMDLDRLRQIGK